MKFAVTSQNFRTVTGHAGMTRRFLVFQASVPDEVAEVTRLDLPKELAFHEFAGGAHPIDGVDVLLTGSAGEGFHRKIGRPRHLRRGHGQADRRKASAKARRAHHAARAARTRGRLRLRRQALTRGAGAISPGSPPCAGGGSRAPRRGLPPGRTGTGRNSRTFPGRS